jgi:hypothetical protein
VLPARDRAEVLDRDLWRRLAQLIVALSMSIAHEYLLSYLSLRSQNLPQSLYEN